MQRRFLKFLASRGRISTSDPAFLRLEQRPFREVVGAIALGHNLIDLDQLDEILGCLTRDARFGEVAVGLGHLSQQQVDRLLTIQEMQEVLEVCESLILRGELTRETLMSELAAFFQSVIAAEQVPAS